MASTHNPARHLVPSHRVLALVARHAVLVLVVDGITALVHAPLALRVVLTIACAVGHRHWHHRRR
jgi:hypothetical protein